MKFLIEWESFSIAGNPRINPSPQDKDRVWCGGWCPIEAANQKTALDLFFNLVPHETPRIVSIT